MKHYLVWTLLAIGVLLCLEGKQSKAQGRFRRGARNPIARPTYSPYLNLLRPGNPLFSNYYGLVRPEQRFRASVQSLQGQLRSTNERIDQVGSGGLPETGHKTTFLDTRGYFLSGSASGTRRGTTGGRRGGSGTTRTSGGPRGR